MAADLSKKLYVGNSADWEKNLNQKRFTDKKLEVKVIERGIILPAQKTDGTWKGGVCDNDFNFIAGFTRTDPVSKKRGERFATVESSYTIDRKELAQLDEDVIFGGSLIGHFGHFMLECWSRLYFVIKFSELPLKVLFLTTSHGGYQSWFDDFFRLMGIDKERIVYVDKPIQCRSIIVPEQSAYTPVSFAKEFLIPYQTIKAHVVPNNHKKLYLTRTEFEADDSIGVHCYNEKYFEDFFVARGFEAISPEKFSVDEQISLIMGADEIAATIGTLTHWAMFCKPDTKFVMLNRTDSHISSYQCMINEAFSVKNFYVVDISRNFMHANRTVGVIMLGSNKYWKKFVADYFGEKIEEDDDALYFEEALDKYINFWCRKYSSTKNLDLYVSSFKNMCHKIVALESEAIKKRPILTYQTHVARKGWNSWISENQISNSLEQNDIQAIKINFSAHKVFYSVYFDKTWSEEVISPNMAGTTGQSKPITGIKMRLDEEGAKKFDILYRVHKFDGSWSAWAKNGEAIYSHGQKLNAVQIKLENKSPA